MTKSPHLGTIQPPYKLVLALAAAFWVWQVTACSTLEPTLVPVPAVLRVEATPVDATVYIDGVNKGRAPVKLQLPAASYTIHIQSQGYTPWEQVIELRPGEEVVINEALRDAAVPIITWSELAPISEVDMTLHVQAQATDNVTVTQMRLWIDRQLVFEASGSTLQFAWNTQGVSAGLHSLIVQAEDDAGNTGQDERSVTLQPATRARPTTASSASLATTDEVSVRETTVTLNAYPYEDFLKERFDPSHNMPVTWLDRLAYEASKPQPRPRSFKAVILENQYLKLTFLPELGGRLYQCTFKPTGQDVFYHNSVLKPSFWGPLQRDENWWLAAGGLEWVLPVNEHGYEFGTTWTYRIERGSHEAAVVLRDSDATTRLCAEVRVTLPEGAAYWVVAPRLVNPTDQSITCQFWLNAALTLGSSSVSPNTEFVYPTERMIVHSTGDATLPGEHQSLSWPVFQKRDLSRYGNWRNWLGVFVPDVQQDYVGAYSHDTDLGIVRLFPHQTVPGLKLFAFGSGFPARVEYTDDGSEYWELWGGPCRTFWPEDDFTLQAHQTLQWSEIWMPFRGIGGLDQASNELAVKSNVRDGLASIGIASARALDVRVTLRWNDQALAEQHGHATPDMPLELQVPLPKEASLTGALSLQVQDERGATLLEYTKNIAL